MSDTIRASSAQRIALCPGSRAAEDGLPDQQSADAAAGTKMHAVLAYGCAHGLDGDEGQFWTDAEGELALAMIRRAEEAIGFPLVNAEVIQAELELARGLWTGHADLIVAKTLQSDLHVIDWKTGFADVVDAESNAQLRVYACLASGSVIGGQPKAVVGHIVTRTGATSVRYEIEALAGAWRELEAIADLSFVRDAPRVPSPQACRYCRAFGTPRCHETCRLEAKAAEAMPEAAGALESLPAERLGEIGRLWALVKRRGKMVETEIKDRLARGESVSGWALKDGAVRRSIDDVPAAFVALADLPESALIAACKLTPAAVEKAVKEALGLKAKEAKAWAEKRLGALISEERAEPSLVEADS